MNFTVKDGIVLAVFVGVLYGGYKLYKMLMDPNGLLGYNGALGNAVEKSAFEGVVNNHSQGFYNSAMQQTSYDDGNQSSLDVQGTDKWPWTSYDVWVKAGYPPLPNSSLISAGSDGVYHNEYF